jgi:hypothetical protein
VSFKSSFAPIPGFANTGNIPGTGAAAHLEYTVSGTEYLGSPPPIVGINFYLPKGTTLHPDRFPTCAKSVLQSMGPSGCSASSEAGPVGEVKGTVAFGDTRVREALSWQSFYAPGGGLEFAILGSAPAAIEIYPSGRYATQTDGGGFGPELVTPIPLVETVPGEPPGSFERINTQWGSALQPLHGPAVYYMRVPQNCPKGGFLFKTEVTFDKGGANPIVPETVTATYAAPCP